jgi:hypothetical protein
MGYAAMIEKVILFPGRAETKIDQVTTVTVTDLAGCILHFRNEPFATCDCVGRAGLGSLWRWEFPAVVHTSESGAILLSMAQRYNG